MAIDPATGIAIAQGVGRFASTLFGRRKRRDFISTAAGQEVQRRTEEGDLNQAAQRQIVGEVAAATGSAAQIARSQARGRLAAQGISGSAAGEAALGAPGRQQQEAVASASERLGTLNEQSKAQARRELAAGITGTQEAQDIESAQFRRDLIGSASQAVAGIIEGVAVDRASLETIEQLASAEQTQRLRLLLSVELAKGAGAVITPEIQALLNEIIGRQSQ